MFGTKKLVSAKYAQRKRRVRAAKIFFFSASLIFVVASFSYVCRLPSQRIQAVEVSGNSFVAQQDIISLASSTLSGSYVWLFPKDAVLFYPRASLTSSILKAFPQISRLDVATVNWNTLSLTVTERKTVALWCAGEPDASGSCYLTDADGFIFAKAPQFSDNVFLRYYGGEVHSDDPVGEKYLQNTFPEMNEFLHMLISAGIPAVGLISREGDEYEILLKNSEGGTAKIFVDTPQPDEKLLINLSTVWKEKIAPMIRTGKSLEYIDLRYGNKVYFKVQ